MKRIKKPFLLFLVPIFGISLLSGCDSDKNQPKNNDINNKTTDEFDDGSEGFSNEQKDALLNNLKSLNNATVNLNFEAVYNSGSSITGKNTLLANINYRRDGEKFLKEFSSSDITKYNLHEYAADREKTIGEIKEDAAKDEKYSVDEINDELTISYISDYEVFYGYDASIGQAFQKSTEEDFNPELPNSRFLIETEKNQVVNNFSLLISMVEKILKNGTLSEQKDTIVLSGTLKEANDLLRQELEIGLLFEYSKLYIENNSIRKMELKIDQNSGNSFSRNASIISSSVLFELKEVGTTFIEAQSSENIECDEHEINSFEYTENGYRKYCPRCHKYLDELKPYNYDPVTHICKDSGNIEGIYANTERVYPEEFFVEDDPNQGKLYWVSYQIGSDGKFYNPDFYSYIVYGMGDGFYKRLNLNQFSTNRYIAKDSGCCIYLKDSFVSSVAGSPYVLRSKTYYFYDEFDYEIPHEGFEDYDNLLRALNSKLDNNQVKKQIVIYYVGLAD